MRFMKFFITLLAEKKSWIRPWVDDIRLFLIEVKYDVSSNESLIVCFDWISFWHVILWAIFVSSFVCVVFIFAKSLLGQDCLFSLFVVFLVQIILHIRRPCSGVPRLIIQASKSYKRLLLAFFPPNARRIIYLASGLNKSNKTPPNHSRIFPYSTVLLYPLMGEWNKILKPN